MVNATALLGLERPYRRRGDVLRYNLAFALIRASQIVRGLRQGLTEDERYAVADHVVAQLKEHGDLWRLSEEARGLVQGYVEHYNVRLNSAIGYITPKDMLAGHQQEIQAERDRKLEAMRQQRKNRRQRAA